MAQLCSHLARQCNHGPSLSPHWDEIKSLSLEWYFSSSVPRFWIIYIQAFALCSVLFSFLSITSLIMGIKSGDWAGLCWIHTHCHCWQIFNHLSPKTDGNICLLQSYDRNLEENKLILFWSESITKTFASRKTGRHQKVAHQKEDFSLKQASNLTLNPILQ